MAKEKSDTVYLTVDGYTFIVPKYILKLPEQDKIQFSRALEASFRKSVQDFEGIIKPELLAQNWNTQICFLQSTRTNPSEYLLLEEELKNHFTCLTEMMQFSDELLNSISDLLQMIDVSKRFTIEGFQVKEQSYIADNASILSEQIRIIESLLSNGVKLQQKFFDIPSETRVAIFSLHEFLVKITIPEALSKLISDIKENVTGMEGISPYIPHHNIELAGELVKEAPNSVDAEEQLG